MSHFGELVDDNKDSMQVLFHKHVWLYSEYMPTLHWWIGASSVSPYVITVAWIITSGIILHHRSNAYELFTYFSSLIHFTIAIVTITTKYQKHYFAFITLFLPLPSLSYYSSTKHFAADTKFPGVVELTTQLLILENILWLPLCWINKFGSNTLPSKAVVIPYTCGLPMTSLELLIHQRVEGVFCQHNSVMTVLVMWSTQGFT